MKEQILHPSLQLDGPGGKDHDPLALANAKAFGAGGGDKTASGIRSGHQKYRGCCTFQYTDERQMEKHSLENILQQQRKDTLPPLPLLAQTQFLRTGLRKDICPRHKS